MVKEEKIKAHLAGRKQFFFVGMNKQICVKLTKK